jgi:hypothetical protein
MFIEIRALPVWPQQHGGAAVKWLDSPGGSRKKIYETQNENMDMDDFAEYDRTHLNARAG